MIIKPIYFLIIVMVRKVSTATPDKKACDYWKKHLLDVILFASMPVVCGVLVFYMM